MRVLVAIVLLNLCFGVATKAQNINQPLLQEYVEGLEGTQISMSSAIDGADKATTINKVISKKILGNFPVAATLAYQYNRTSPSGTYYTYGLEYNGEKVYGKHLKVFLDQNNTIRWLYHNLQGFGEPVNALFLPSDKIEAFSKTNYPNQRLVSYEVVWMQHKNQLQTGFSLTLQNLADLRYNEYVFNNAGSLLYKNAIDKHFAQLDTPAHGYVFNPDPLTSAKVFYGGAYSNNNGGDNLQLTAERVKKSFIASIEGDSLILSNPDFLVQEISTPSWPTTRVAINDTFNFTRSQHQFGDVNAFYHLNFYLNYVRSLGFATLPGFRIQVDAHALNGQDASRFTSGDNPPSLQFGDGGVPDAEDADVVVHEFGHALSFGASPNTAIGAQRRAIEEGLGDYFAASYSWGISTHNWQKVFSWDGNNGGWQGRTVEYKGSHTNLTNNIWTDGQLWSTAFMRILRFIGKEKADRLMFEALYRLSSNMSMPQLAMAVHQIDTIQNGGVNFEQIQCSFAMVDILDSLGSCDILGVGGRVSPEKESIFKLYNTYGFAVRGEDAVLYLNKESFYTLAIFDVTGKVVSEEKILGGDTKKIRGQEFAPGIYFFKVSDANGNTQSAKLIRY